MRIAGALVSRTEVGKEPIFHFDVSIDGTPRGTINYVDIKQRLFDRPAAEESDANMGIGIGTELENIASPLPVDELVSKEALDFLLKDICRSDELLTQDEELIVVSASHLFLRLPWETKIDRKSTGVFRQIEGGASSKRREESAQRAARFIIVRSHAYQTLRGNLEDGGEEMKDEVRAVVDELTDRTTSPLRVSAIRVVKHGTKTEVARIDFREHDYVHFIMHGEKDGSLCLENIGNPEQIDSLSREEFINLLSSGGTRGVLLFLLSFCYSAGGAISEANLSFELVNRDMAEYVVGYEGRVGNTFSSQFAKDFYPSIASGKTIKESFVEASRKRLSEKYIPLLYGRYFELNSSI